MGYIDYDMTFSIIVPGISPRPISNLQLRCRAWYGSLGLIPGRYGKCHVRRVWRYQRGNQNPYIEEQTTQWPKEKVQKDKQRSTKHTCTYKTTDRVTRTPLKTGRVSISCSTSDTRRVNLDTNPVITHERGKDREVFTTSGTYPWSFVTQIFHNGQPSRVGDRNTFEVMTST